MKICSLKITAVILLIAIIAYSCEKDARCTSGDCVTVNIKGALRVQPSGEGLNDVPVEAFFHKTGSVRNTSRRISSESTNRNGEFNIKATIDKNFKNGYLRVVIPHQKNYIYSSNIKYFYDWDDNREALNNISFEFYNKAILTINLIRTPINDFDSFGVVFESVKGPQHCTFDTPYPNSKIEIRQVETAADVYTKIWLWKQINEETFLVSLDSLICRQNSNNVYIKKL